MNRKILLILTAMMLITFTKQDTVCAEEKGGDTSNIFLVEQPDYQKSPHTGMTRKHWMDAARYLLDGAFSYVHSLDDAMRFPKQPGVSYPQDEKWNNTENLEGLCRTMFVAIPLLKETPGLELNGVKVGDYYRKQLCNMSDPEKKGYIKHRTGGPSQILVEFGGLAVSLTAMPEILWDPLSQGDKDALAALMLSYGNGPTIGSNWRFFNIFVMSFFKDRGYEVNDKHLQELLQLSLKQYRGYGWYNDSPAYDYYSMWAFQMYGMLWSHYYSEKFNPEAGREFTSNFADLVPNYPYLFSKEGKMVMYGRSMCYRTAAIVPFPLMGWLNDPSVNYGWMRRIASSTLLQFFQHPDMMKDRVPTLGFYGPFDPAVQIYTCRGSVYWMAKAFLGLLVPADNPFWTATENEGAWKDELKPYQVYNKFMPGSNTLVTDYPNSGASEIRAWCHETVAKDWQKFRSTENYNKLSYNSEFLWMADGANGEVAMNYAIKNAQSKWEVLRLYTFKKFEDGIYYRDAVLETDTNITFRLADIPLPNGILRVDKARSPQSIELRLGHYSLPQFDSPISEKRIKTKNGEACIINNGKYQLAMIPVAGFQNTVFTHATGLHPESDKCTVVNAIDRLSNEKIYITLMLWKKGDKAFSSKELEPIKKYTISGNGQSIEIILQDDSKKTVQFEK